MQLQQTTPSHTHTHYLPNPTQALKTIAENCPRLQELHLRHCIEVGHKSLRHVAAGCPDLRKLDLFKCEKVNNKVLRALARGCPMLEWLNLEKTDTDNITDSGVKALVRGCRHLVHLNMPNCRRVSDLGLLAIAEANMAPGLEYLNLAGMRDVTETGIAWLSEKCKTLLTLNVKGCTVPRVALKGLRQVWNGWCNILLWEQEVFE